MSSPLVNQLRKVAEQAAAPMVADVANEVGVCVGLEDGSPVIELYDSGVRLRSDDAQWFGVRPGQVDEGDRVLVLSLGPEYLVAALDADAAGNEAALDELREDVIALAELVESLRKQVSQSYSVTAGYTADRAFNPVATSVDEVARVLGTLIDDLKAAGLIAP